MKKSVIEIVNEKIIEKLEKGVNPWRKPWNYPTAKANPKNIAINYISNKAYNGINQVLLDSGYYLTFKQIQEIGGHLKKGSKGEMVIYSAPTQYKTSETDPTTGEEIEETKNGFILKYYYVYKLEDVENYKPIKNRGENIDSTTYKTQTAEEIDNIINDYAKRSNLRVFIKNSNEAYYSPLLHKVVVPQVSQYKQQEEYYSTFFHELGHSTGHSTLLNRDTLNTINHWGDNTYAKEELIAEITSAYCLNYLGLENDKVLDNNVAYLQSWAKQLKNNTASYFILNATTQATKAFKLIMNIQE